MKLKIEIEMNNAAFDPEIGHAAHEVARILREYAEDLRVGNHGFNRTVRDANGNKVGEARIYY